MNGIELRQLAEDRALDAQALLAVGRWSGAYYLAGYAVECGLKACVLVRIERTGVIFEDKRFVEKCWTHDVDELMTHAGLQAELAVDMAANLGFVLNWRVVKDWSELSRYKQISELDSRRLYEAVTDSANGVLTWIRSRW